MRGIKPGMVSTTAGAPQQRQAGAPGAGLALGAQLGQGIKDAQSASFLDAVLPESEVDKHDTKTVAAGKEAYNLLTAIPRFATSGAGFETGPAAAAAPLITAGAFTVDQIHQLGNIIRNTWDNWGDMTGAEKTKAIMDGVATGLFASVLAKNVDTGVREKFGKGGDSNAKTVRSDQGQVRQPGNAPQGGQDASRENLQFGSPQAPQPVGQGEEGAQTGRLEDLPPPQPAKPGYRLEGGEGRFTVTTPEGDTHEFGNLTDAKIALDQMKMAPAIKKQAAAPKSTSPDLGTIVPKSEQSKTSPADRVMKSMNDIDFSSIQKPHEVGVIDGLQMGPADVDKLKASQKQSVEEMKASVKSDPGKFQHLMGKNAYIGGLIEGASKKGANYDHYVAAQKAEAQKLEPEVQNHVNGAAEKLGVKVKLTAPDDPNNPFSKSKDSNMASIDRKTGEVLINKDAFMKWYKDVPPEKRQQAVDSVIAEERNHLATDDAAADAYWHTKTAVEKKIIKDRYSGGEEAGMNDTMWGHEAINFEMQRLARMTPHQIVTAAKGEGWKLKSLMVLETAIRGIRKALGTKASKEGSAILDKIQEGINHGREALGGGRPGARPRKRPESVFQDKFFLPDVESLKVPGTGEILPLKGELPPVPPEERKSAEGAGALPRPAGVVLDKMATDWIGGKMDDLAKGLETGGKPSTMKYDDFVDHLKGKGASLQPGQMFEMWQNTIAKSLDTMTGDQLRNVALSEFGRRQGMKAIKRVESARAEKGDEGALALESGKEGARSIWDRQIPDKDQTDVATRYGKLEKRLDDLREQKAELIDTEDHETADVDQIDNAIREAMAEKKSLEEGYQSVLRGQKWRNRVISAVYRRMVKPVMVEHDERLERKKITPEDIRAGGGDNLGAYEDVSDYPVDKLGPLLRDNARRSNEDAPNISRRLLVLLNPRSETVHIVSVYPRGDEMRVVDPLSPQRATSPLDSIMNRYKVLHSILLDEPVKNFRQDFGDLHEYNEEFGNQAKEMEEAARSYSPNDMSEEEFMAAGGGRISGGEGGSFQGPHKNLVAESGINSLEQSRSTPMTDSEAGKITSFIRSKGRPTTVSEVQELLLTLKANRRQLVSALSKFARAVEAKYPDMSQQEVLDTVAKKLYEIHQEQDYRRIVKRTMAESLPEARPAARPEAEKQTGRELSLPINRRSPASVTGIDVKSPGSTEALPTGGPGQTYGAGHVGPVEQMTPEELQHVTEMAQTHEKQKTTGISEDSPVARQKQAIRASRMDVDAANEVLKREKGPGWFAHERPGGDTKPDEYQVGRLQKVPRENLEDSGFSAVIEGRSNYSFEDALLKAGVDPDKLAQTKTPMAVNRKYLREEKERLRAQYGVEKARLGAALKRGATSDTLAASRDGLETIANTGARVSESSIRLVTAEGGFKQFYGNKDILAAAKALISAKAIKARLHFDDEAMQEYERLLKEDEQVKKKKAFLDHLKKDAAIKKNMKIDSPATHQAVADMHQEFSNLMQDKLIRSGHVRPSQSTYYHDTLVKPKLDEFMKRIMLGNAKAERMIRTVNPWSKYVGYKWKAANAKLMQELEFAKAHWDNPELIETAMNARRELDRQFDYERSQGHELNYDPFYLPGRYDGEMFAPNKVIFGSRSVLGKNFRAAGEFDTYYHAAEAGPYIPASYDVASIVGSRVRQGLRSINLRMWWDNLKELNDEATKKPIASDGRKSKYGVMGPPEKGYVEFIKPDHQKIYVLEGYEHLVHQLTDPSHVQNWALTRAALETGQFLKHTVLLGDLFHLGRVFYYSASIVGRNAYYRPGWAALDFRAKDLPKALEKGLISQQTMDWLNEPLAYREEGRPVTMTRHELARVFQNQGLNVGQIQDAVFKDLVANIPGFGKYNRFLFDRFTRGQMMNAALREFDRISKIDPEADSKAVVRDISKNINTYFGSIGRQGWIKSATFQDIARLTFLAPQWLEGLVKKEISPIRALTQPKKVFSGRDTTTRGIARGLLGMVVLTQVLNMITRRQPTWQNEEKEHKWDAYLGDNIWLSPLAVFNEITGDLIRINETRPKFWDAIQQVGENKLAFWGRAGMVLATGKSGTGEYQTTTAGVLEEAGKQMIPTPISAGVFLKAAGHAVAPGMVGPVPAGKMLSQTMSSMGLKTHPGMSSETRVEHSAQAFIQKHNLRPEAAVIGFTDQPAYSKMRYLLNIGDVNGSRKVMEDLEKTRPAGDIIKAMRNWTRRPFTGSQRSERLWLNEMTDEERAQYQKAIAERYELEDKFQEMLH